MRVLGQFAVVYLVQGSGEFADAFGYSRKVAEGDLIWLFPEVAHCYGPSRGGRWDEIYLVFEGPIFEVWRQRGLISANAPIWNLQPVSFWLERVVREVQRPAADGAQALMQAASLQVLFAEMWSAQQRKLKGQWLAQARRSLDSDNVPPLPRVAEDAGLPYESFRKQFARQTGLSPLAYAQLRRMERACSLLMQPDLKLRAIADRLGFCDEFHFSKMFRKRMGLSPAAFRRMTLG